MAPHVSIYLYTTKQHYKTVGVGVKTNPDLSEKSEFITATGESSFNIVLTGCTGHAGLNGLPNVVTIT